MKRRFLNPDESGNIRELGKFRAYWGRSSGYPKENFGNTVVYMPVDVHYKWGDSEYREFSSVFRAYIGAGPRDGAIDLDETDDVSVEEFHLSFSPRFQEYSYIKHNHVLQIVGISEKMNGSYTVSIFPTIVEPRQNS